MLLPISLMPSIRQRCRHATREPQFVRLAETQRAPLHFVLDGAPVDALAGRHAADRHPDATTARARQRIQRRAARGLLPDGRLPGLLDAHRRRRAPARLLDAASNAGMRVVTRLAAATVHARCNRRRAMSDDRRVVIVGAGPAGVRAAETLVAAGLRPIVHRRRRALGRADLSAAARRRRASSARRRRSTVSKRSKADAVHRRDGRSCCRSSTIAPTRSCGPASRAASTRLHAGREAQRAVHASDHRDRRDRSRAAGARLDAARRLHARRRAGRAEGAGLRDRPARRVRGHRAAAVSGRLSVREGRRAGRGRARHEPALAAGRRRAAARAASRRRSRRACTTSAGCGRMACGSNAA